MVIGGGGGNRARDSPTSTEKRTPKTSPMESRSRIVYLSGEQSGAQIEKELNRRFIILGFTMFRSALRQMPIDMMRRAMTEMERIGMKYWIETRIMVSMKGLISYCGVLGDFLVGYRFTFNCSLKEIRRNVIKSFRATQG